MIRRPPRSTHCISSAASDVYKRQVSTQSTWEADIDKANKREIRTMFLLFKVLLEITSSLMSYKELASMRYYFNDFNHDKYVNQLNQLQQKLKTSKSLPIDQQVEIKNKIKLAQDQEQELYETQMKEICDFESIIKWEKTIQLLKSISNKSSFELSQHLMIIADEDRSGTLDKEEILQLCGKCLDDMIIPKYTEIKQEMSKYLAELFFSAVAGKNEKEVSMTKVKEIIQKGQFESDIVCFFCTTSIEL
eukprot:TRINITY_DN7808_c0_g2_i8.p1 TRINITY_DN7808_c0_g2~~TRINITY_DN7808_c0_g2_i8.p1  ORF type:complete len:248 (-),score=63.03 TRINITY_DN7808_c0_g2_i8:195-938(-)